jgi:enoyl-CoA hydratase/carnithine racemase
MEIQMLHTICDFQYPTVALITGHTFGGACLFALSHDYRVMNSERGFFCMPPIELGLHFDGIGALPKAKLASRTVRKLLQEAHRFTGKEALEHDIVDAIATPDKMFGVALGLAEKWAPKAKMGVYAAIRSEQLCDVLAKRRLVMYMGGGLIMSLKLRYEVEPEHLQPQVWNREYYEIVTF